MNVVVYTALPPGRRGLIDAFVFILRASTSIVASRIVLNLRGILTRPGRRGGGGLWVFKQRQKKQRGGFGLGKSNGSSGVEDSEGGWGMNRLGKGRDVMTMTMTMFCHTPEKSARMMTVLLTMEKEESKNVGSKP